MGGWNLQGTSGKSPLAILPYAAQWTEGRLRERVTVRVDWGDEQTRGASAESVRCVSGAAVTELVTQLTTLYIVEHTFRKARATWLALRDARQCALREETNAETRRAISAVVDACSRIVASDVILGCDACAHAWDALARVFGEDVGAVCPRCAVVASEAPHVCVWDGQGVVLPEAAELNCLALMSRLEDGYSPSERRTLFRRLASKEQTLARAPLEAPTPDTHFWWEAAIVSLRAWCGDDSNSNLARLQLEDLAGATRHTCAALRSLPRPTVAFALVLMGAAAFRQIGQAEPRSANQPRCETVTRAETVDVAQFRILPDFLSGSFCSTCAAATLLRDCGRWSSTGNAYSNSSARVGLS